MRQASLFWLAGACTVLLSRYPMGSAFDYGLLASAGKFPFVVGLYYVDGTTKESLLDQSPTHLAIPFCTGTIATVEWVITTRRCLYVTNRHSKVVFSPSEDSKNIKMVAGTAFSPINTTTIDRYIVKSGKDIKVPRPDNKGMNEIFDWTEEEAKKITKDWDDFTDINGKTHYRYFLDIALIQTDTPWEISVYVQTAPFPIGFRETHQYWWDDKVKGILNGVDYMQPCYAIGWGGWDESVQQVRMRYTKVKFVPYTNCELSYCTECSYCNRSIRLNSRVEACYKSYFHGDACEGDEGAPVWCPWMRTSLTQWSTTGAVMGFLSWRAGCVGKSVPSIYVHSWNTYPMLTIVRAGAQFPPDLWLFQD